MAVTNQTTAAMSLLLFLFIAFLIVSACFFTFCKPVEFIDARQPDPVRQLGDNMR